MRYYVEAYRPDGSQVLGTGSGQAALGDLRQPKRSAAWRSVLARKGRDPWKGANRWRLVDATGRVLAEHVAPCSACWNVGFPYGCAACGWKSAPVFVDTGR